MLWMTPGCDLHLIIGATAPVRAGVQAVRILPMHPGQLVDVAATAVYTGFDPHIVTVAGGVFTAVAAGSTFGLVTFTEIVNGANVDYTGYVTVHVHTAVTNIWVANKRITLRVGAEDYIPTIFAQFDDQSIADVTGHAWLDLSTSANAPFVLTAGDPLGRLHATGIAGDHGSVVVRVGSLTSSAPVTLSAALNAERRIATPLLYHGDHTTRRNILFLGEGFLDHVEFEKHVTKIVDVMFTSAALSPYPYLADRINVWFAFEDPPAASAPEAGTTIASLVNDKGEQYPSAAFSDANHYSAPELTALLGLPPGPGSPTDLAAAKLAWAGVAHFDPNLLDQVGFDGWRGQQHLAPIIPRDTTFGYMFGGRAGGPDAPSRRAPTTRVPDPNAHWELLNALTGLSLTIDPRRLIEEPTLAGHYNPFVSAAPNAMFQEYLGGLKYGIDPAHPDFHIGRVWQNGGQDGGLIALLLNEELVGGTAMSTAINGRRERVAFAISLGRATALKLAPGAMPADHTVAIKPVYDQIASTLLHELGHALGLGDEYENKDRDGGSDATNEPPADFEESSNLMHGSNIVRAQPPPSPPLVIGANIKWNWNRILLASVVTQVDPPAPGTQTPSMIQLEPTQGLKWEEARVKNLDVYLRVREINAFGPAAVPPVGPFKITSVTGDTLVLNGPAIPVMQYVAGSVLFLPSMNGLTQRHLVHPAVVAYLETKGPFGRITDPTFSTVGGESAPKHIPNFSKPKHRESVIGVYDGGGTWNTGVYRACGNCIMRDPQVENDTEWRRWFIFPHRVDVRRIRGFCFVCKYILINELWPGAYDHLDREYPEDC